MPGGYLLLGDGSNFYLKFGKSFPNPRLLVPDRWIWRLAKQDQSRIRDAVCTYIEIRIFQNSVESRISLPSLHLNHA